MRRTRILTTIGPASADQSTIGALLAAGTDAFRLNFSHGTPETHAETCRHIRDIASATGRDIGIMQDLSGPKIRIGAVDAPLDLADGDSLVIEQGDFVGTTGRVSSTADALFTSMRAGHRLLLDDGRIELEVSDVAPGRLTTRVVAGGRLESHKGINVPGVALRTSALTPKDHEDLRAGIAMGVDLVALSFVQSGDDVRAAKAAAAAGGAPDIPIIAKIEKPQAVEHLDDILQVADGLMVARGDLGIELPLETLPAVQKRLIVAARRRGMPVIVATQVLQSMTTEPRPTRAEVSDAANAVDDGVDAIMLSGETAAGAYPVRAVHTLDLVICEAESMPSSRLLQLERSRLLSGHQHAVCEAAVTLAERGEAAAIVAITRGGTTARVLSALRTRVPIFAATDRPEIARRLALSWGVVPVLTDISEDVATTGKRISDDLLARHALEPGALVVFVSVSEELGPGPINFVKLQKI